jgi:hypothetical protein
MDERSPEKAGVGGSIPSLATMFSITYEPPKSGFGPNWSNSARKDLSQQLSRFVAFAFLENKRPALPVDTRAARQLHAPASALRQCGGVR